MDLKNSHPVERNYCCADLHIHSTYSDGLLTPSEIIKLSKELQLKAIAITDHDTVSGVEETLHAAQKSIDVIPAVEMSSNIGVLDIHILGYYIDIKNDELISYLEDFQQHRAQRAKIMIEKLSDDGIKLDFDQIKENAKNAALGRPHIAEALIQDGYVRSINEAFIRYLGYHSPYYEPKKDVHPKKVIQNIKDWGGIPVIAHPGTIDREKLTNQLIMDGAIGIEVWHPDHTQSLQKKLYEIALKNGLVMTGGSDYHGFRGAYDQIGKCGCSEKEVISLKQMAGI